MNEDCFPKPESVEVKLAVESAKLLLKHIELEKKYDTLCRAVDNLLGHDCGQGLAGDFFCVFCDGIDNEHKKDCPWKILQDIMNGG